MLDLTSVTVEEFQALVAPFEAAFLGYLADWTRHGRRRQARRYTTDTNCPLPTPEDRLLFILVYLQPNPTQLLHGRLFGMRQSKATPWIHVLLPVLRNTLRTLGDAPCRHVEALREQLGVACPPVPGDAVPAEEVQALPPTAAPLVVTTGPNDPFRAPTMRLNRKRVIAARKHGTG